MQILASALPGFRDLRAPLVAGYLWLVFLWILIKPDIRNRPTNEVAGAVYDLAMDVGPIWIGLAVGVFAYLIGSVSQALSPILGHKAIPEIAEAARNLVPWLGRDQLVDIPEFNLIKQYIAEAERKVGEDRALTYANAISRRLNAELDLPATLLLTERGREPDQQLFSEADRLKAERELRLAVVPPLCAIVVLLGCSQSSWWWFGLIPVAVVLWQAHSRNLAFRTLMFGALERGLARSSTIDEYKRWAEGLPEPPVEQKADEDGTRRS